jgi:hypothetical protein
VSLIIWGHTPEEEGFRIGPEIRRTRQFFPFITIITILCRLIINGNNNNSWFATVSNVAQCLLGPFWYFQTAITALSPRFSSWSFSKYRHLWSSGQRVPGYRSRGLGLDSRRYQIFWEVVGLERLPLSLVSITEKLLEWKNSGSGSGKPRLIAMGIRCADHATPSIHKSLH